eukprot:SM000246S08219  [mRNA]  locus=s246:60438:61141:+ [translate_table: standard]
MRTERSGSLTLRHRPRGGDSTNRLTESGQGQQRRAAVTGWQQTATAELWRRRQQQAAAGLARQQQGCVSLGRWSTEESDQGPLLRFSCHPSPEGVTRVAPRALPWRGGPDKGTRQIQQASTQGKRPHESKGLAPRGRRASPRDWRAAQHESKGLAPRGRLVTPRDWRAAQHESKGLAPRSRRATPRDWGHADTGPRPCSLEAERAGQSGQPAGRRSEGELTHPAGLQGVSPR